MLLYVKYQTNGYKTFGSSAKIQLVDLRNSGIVGAASQEQWDF